MKRDDDKGFAGRTSHRWANAQNREAIGPQGEALILELQRLRRAFEHEEADARSDQRRGRNSANRDRSLHPRRRRKGTMGRVVEACLGPFGLAPRAPAPSHDHPKAREASAAPPARQHSGISHASSPVSFEPAEIRLDGNYQSMHIESPPMAPSGDVDTTPTSTSATGQLVASCANALGKGIAFLLRSEGSDGDGQVDENLTLSAGRAFERELRTGLRVLIIALVLAGGWAALVPLAGAVVVPGNLVVQSNVKAVQHPSGGVIAEIAVHNGQRVNSGDLLVRLDATQAQASLQVISKQLDEVRAKIARLVAERDGLSELAIASELLARAGDDSVKTLLSSEDSLLKARATARRSQIDLLQSRISQLGEQIVGLDAQVDSKAKQLELISGELSGVQELYDKRLVPLARLTALQRESARIEGERGQLLSSIAETRSKIGEAQLQILRIGQDFRADVVKELGENQGKEAELVERSVAARDLLDRIEIRAPTSGVIQQLSVHTVGGVIRAGDQIMEVVPDLDDLQIEARLQPNDIDQVRMGQGAFVRFSAFNQRMTPQLNGTVSYVSPDVSRDQQTNASYFTVRVALSEAERRRLAGLQLVPGMPAEVFMQTGSRTMLSYLFKPITDQMRRAFVEQ